MRLDDGGCDHQPVGNITLTGKGGEYPFPDAAVGPAHEAVMRRVFFGPYAPGASAQRPPERMTCTIPLSTRRSSTRFSPRVFDGSNGAIRAHCVSENQNKSAICNPPKMRIESDHHQFGNPLKGSGP